MKLNKIKSYWMRYDEEDQCYSVEIDTGTCCISYPRAMVAFSVADDMALPVLITVLDENKNKVNEYSLVANSNVSNNEANEPEQLM